MIDRTCGRPAGHDLRSWGTLPPMPGQPPTDPRKLSEALLDVADPMLREVGEDAPSPAVLGCLQIASLVWNSVVLERCHGDAEPSRLLAEALSEAPGEMRSAFAAFFERKRAEDPFDDRWIVDVELVHRSGEDHDLRVSGVPLSAVRPETVAEAFEVGLERSRLFFEDPRSLSGESGAVSGERLKSAPKPADGEEPWATVFALAKELHALAPWESHLDRDVLGIRIDGDDEVYWCSIMGAGGSFYGIALYRGDQGYHAFRRVLSGEESDAIALGFDGFLFSFSDREDLKAAERRRIKASGVRFRGRGHWPQLDSVRPGRLPRSITEEDAPIVGALLETLIAAILTRSISGLPESIDLDGEIPVYSLVGRDVARHAEIPQLVPADPIPAVDQLAIQRLRASAASEDLVIEFDAFAPETRVTDDDGWEFVPLVYVAVDVSSGMLMSVAIGTAEVRESECGQRLLDVLGQHGAVPREVRVGRDWVQRAVAPTLEALGVRVVRTPELPYIWSIAASLEAFLPS